MIGEECSLRTARISSREVEARTGAVFTLEVLLETILTHKHNL